MDFKISKGTTRIVLLFYSYAFKFPTIINWRLFLQGLLANMQEAEFSKTQWPKLCPVLWSINGGLLVVMRRARILTLDEFEQIDFNLWCDCGEYFIPAEIKVDSFGWIDGKLVTVDYGN